METLHDIGHITLPLSHSATAHALRTGWIEDEGLAPQKYLRAIARSLVQNTSEPQNPDVIFEIVKDQMRPSGIKPWLQMIRAFSLTATVTPCIAILLYAFHLNSTVHLFGAITAVLGVCFLQIAINVFNDVEDYRRLIDLYGTNGGSGVIQNGWWTPQQLSRIAWWAFGVGAISGLLTVVNEPSVLVPIAVVAGFGTLSYSSRILGLKYLALGDLVVFVLCGPALTVGYSVAISSTYDLGAIQIGCFFGLLAVSILHVNNLQDMNLDRSRNVKTLVTVLGYRRSQFFLVGVHILAALTLITAVAKGELPLPIILAVIVQLALAVPWLKRILKASGPESALLINVRVRAAQIHLLSGLALCLGLAAAIRFETVAR